MVYDPCADELYQAVRGFGAFVNGRKASSSGCTELGNAVVVSGENRARVSVQNIHTRDHKKKDNPFGTILTVTC